MLAHGDRLFQGHFGLVGQSHELRRLAQFAPDQRVPWIELAGPAQHRQGVGLVAALYQAGAEEMQGAGVGDLRIGFDDLQRVQRRAPRIAVPAHLRNGMGALRQEADLQRMAVGHPPQGFRKYGLGLAETDGADRRQGPQPIGLPIIGLVAEHALGGVDGGVGLVLLQGRPGFRQPGLHRIDGFGPGP